MSFLWWEILQVTYILRWIRSACRKKMTYKSNIACLPMREVLLTGQLLYVCHNILEVSSGGEVPVSQGTAMGDGAVQ